MSDACRLSWVHCQPTNGVSVAARHAGFSEWAESNAIILVFPAAHASVNYGWDWTGAVVGPLFDTKHGAQLQTVIAMLSDLLLQSSVRHHHRRRHHRQAATQASFSIY